MVTVRSCGDNCENGSWGLVKWCGLQYETKSSDSEVPKFPCPLADLCLNNELSHTHTHTYKHCHTHRVVILALSSDDRPADFRIGQLRFAFSRLRFAWVSPGVVCWDWLWKWTLVYANSILHAWDLIANSDSETMKVEERARWRAREETHSVRLKESLIL
jgi:hypothetical protein